MFTVSRTSWLLLVIFTLGTSQEHDSDLKCKRNNGVCILLRQCQQALDLIKLGDFGTLRGLFCRFQKKEVVVCCQRNTTEDKITFMNKIDDPVATARPQPTTTTTTRRPSTTRRITTTMPLTTTDNFYSQDNDLAHNGSPLTSIILTPSSTKKRKDQKDEYGFPDRDICGMVASSDRILGGSVAAIEDFPWLARIFYERDNKTLFGCAGSLITERFIVTAAHCIDRYPIVGVRLGEWDAESELDCYEGTCSDPPVDVGVDRVVKHPRYNRIDYNSDIALLRLKRPVEFTDFVRPICLPTTEFIARQDYLPDSVYETAGWGVTETGALSKVKRKIELPAVQLDLCVAALPYLSQSIGPTVICAGGRAGADSCAGDSGGSLARLVAEERRYNWYLYGITSLGSKLCGIETKPAIYTRVTSYLNWIIQNIQ